MKGKRGDDNLAQHRTIQLAAIILVGILAFFLISLSLQVRIAAASATNPYQVYLPVVVKNAIPGG
jgi:hypothetical protein